MADGIVFISDVGPELIPRTHGAKACGLQYLMRRGLAVPAAFVIDIGASARVESGELAVDLGHAVDRLIAGAGDTKLAVRSGAETSLPGALETCLGVDPESVAEAVVSVVASRRSPQAATIATAMGLDSVPPTAVVVQIEVDAVGDDDSGAGAALSRNPIDGTLHVTGSYAFRTRGDAVMAGRSPVESLDGLGRRHPEIVSRLVADLRALDSDVGGPVEVEFVVEAGRLWYLQFRQVDVVDPSERQSLPEGVSIVGFGRAASPGLAEGELITDVGDALDAIDAGRRVVLALGTTSPSDVEAVTKAAGVITVVGGPECHAAVITRAGGVPAVVSVGGLVIADDHVMIGRVRIAVGEELVVDGTNGMIGSATVTP